MRSLTVGSVVLAFAIVLLSWDASRRYAHVRLPANLGMFQASESAVDSHAALQRKSDPRSEGVRK